MKRLFICIIIYACLIFLIPSIAVFISGGFAPSKPQMPLSAEYKKQAEEKLGKPPYKIKSYIVSADEVREFDLEEYLVGVVGAEMPASFPEEALKAQAVAARTFIISRIMASKGDVAEHKGAPVCTNPAHCKAWKSVDELTAAWGDNAKENLSKIEKAVKSTENEIAVWNGAPISAVYYSMSSGNTENAADVWGGDVPYLKSVSSSFDENAPNFNSTAEFTLDEFKKIILSEAPEAVFGENPSEWFSEPTLSEGGGVMSIKIGGAEFKGTKIRSMFSLRSHNFSITPEGDKIIFKVKGYGHGVGLSQWGSKFLADSGKNYIDILKYYYTGIDVVKQ